MNKEIKDINQVGWDIRMLNPSEEMIKESEKHVEVYKLIKKVLGNYKPQSEEEQNYKERFAKWSIHYRFDNRAINLIKYLLSNLENLELNKWQFRAIVDYLWMMSFKFFTSPYQGILEFAIKEKENMFLTNRIKDYIKSQGITVNLDDEELCKNTVEGFNKEYVNVVINRK